MKINRRNFLKTLSAAPVGMVGFSSMGQATGTSAKQVVVIGGGFAGSTVAKYIRLWSGKEINVTLVEPNAQHVSCVMSNLILNNRLKLDELKLGYGVLQNQLGVKIVQDKVTSIDGQGQKVKLKSGQWLSYDKLVIATGIGFEKPTGLDFSKVPHAWIAGSQTLKLRKQLQSLEKGDTFVMTVPKSPYRCPPGPYERACLVADILKRKGGGKVIVLDGNSSIQAEKHTFERAFNSLYEGIVDYRTNVSIAAVDSDRRVVHTNQGSVESKVLNVIPNQKANAIVGRNGLSAGGKWAPVDSATYESSLIPGVYIIGDAQATKQPKSAHMANSQAKVCADAILRELYNVPTHVEERLQNITTNSACFSPITRDEASWLTANFAYDNASASMKLTHIGEAEKWNSENFKDMFTWANNLFTDSFF